MFDIEKVMDILLLIILIALFLIILTNPIYFATAHESIIKGNCYDRKSNKINDVTCDVKIYCGGFPSFLDSPECSTHKGGAP